MKDYDNFFLPAAGFEDPFGNRLGITDYSVQASARTEKQDWLRRGGKAR